MPILEYVFGSLNIFHLLLRYLHLYVALLLPTFTDTFFCCFYRPCRYFFDLLCTNNEMPFT
jgi:hypothetical protein